MANLTDVYRRHTVIVLSKALTIDYHLYKELIQ